MTKERKRLISIITIALLVVMSIVLINILKPKAESVDHTHIWTSTYNNTKHWEYCKICNEIRNEYSHSLTLVGNGPTCNVYIVLGEYVCNCGYSEKVQRLSHIRPANPTWQDYLRVNHISYQCDRCGGSGANAQSGAHTFNINGKIMTAAQMQAAGYDVHSYGTLECTVCHLKPNLSQHIGYSNSCGICGKSFGTYITYDTPENTYKNGSLVIDLADGLTHYLYFRVYTAGYNGNASASVLNGNNYTVSTPELVQKYSDYWLYRIPVRLTNASVPITGYLGVYSTWTTTNSYGSVAPDGYTIGYTVRAETNPTMNTDLTPPVITNITQKDQTISNDWVTIKEITITGTEKATGIVYITIKNQNGKTIVPRSSATVTNGKFTYICTPELEGDELGSVYTVIVEDYFGNSTSQNITIYKTDSSAPEINSSLIYNQWSGAKTVKLEFLDYGSKGVQLSFNNQTNYVDLSTTDGTTYTWTKTFTGPMNGTQTYKIYVRDGLGNAAVYDLTVGNIDTVKPTIGKITTTTSGTNLVVKIEGSDDLSGIVGYAVTNSNTAPTSWSTSNSVTVSAANARYIWIKDAAGNTRSKPLLKLTATADNSGNGLINLDWSTYTTENVIFKGYQSKDNGSTWQSISLMDYTTVKQIKVLQIYPVADAANQLKTWMETNKYGKDIIKVDSVFIDTFNSNPNGYLKNADGSWKYDVLFFGTWDSNASKDLNTASRDATAAFIQAGGGCIFGHDTIRWDNINSSPLPYFATLKDYVGITANNYWGQGLSNISSTVKIIKKGLFTTYPWEIGEIGTVLTIPQTHSVGQTGNGDIWLEFVNQSAIPLGDKGNFYLTTYNNCSMIQTGHSNGQATADEQKIIANLIFYSYQLSSSTAITDHSAMDNAKPTKPTITVSGTTYKFASSDTGTQYQHKIEAYSKSNLTTVLDISNTTTTTVITGLKEYRYLFDNNANTVMTALSGTSVATTTAQVSNSANAADYKYLHVVAVDNTGNVSDTQTIDLKRTVTVKHYQLTVTGTKPATPFATETYQVVANTSFTAPVNTYTGFTTPAKKTITVGDSTTVEYLYERINYQNKFKHILTGVNYNFVTTVGEAVYGQEYSVDTSYSVTAPKGTVLRNTFASDYSGTKTNYTLGSTFTQPAKVLNNEMYYDPIKYTITYNLDGGTNNSSNPSTYTVVDNITFATPTKKGYDFLGWYTDAALTKPITGVNEGTNNNFTSAEDMHNKLNSRKTGAITLYAKFVIHDYKITTNIKSGVGVVSDTSKVEYLTNTAVLITAGNGHRISKVEVDGVEINFNQGSQTLIKEFSNVEADHVVNVWFEAEDSWKSELDTYHKYEWIDLKFN